MINAAAERTQDADQQRPGAANNCASNGTWRASCRSRFSLRQHELWLSYARWKPIPSSATSSSSCRKRCSSCFNCPPSWHSWYRFDAVELKKSLRIDGLFLPYKAGLPLYFVEVQYRRSAKFYANLFAKVFGFLDENDPGQDWFAVAIFSSRGMEPKKLAPYQALLDSRHVQRIYLDEYPLPADLPFGLGILQLTSAPEADLKDLVARLVAKAEREKADSESAQTVIQLVEEILMRRFTQNDREEIRKMFQLHDLRKSKVWQEARQEGAKKAARRVAKRANRWRRKSSSANVWPGGCPPMKSRIFWKSRRKPCGG